MTPLRLGPYPLFFGGLQKNLFTVLQKQLLRMQIGDLSWNIFTLDKFLVWCLLGPY